MEIVTELRARNLICDGAIGSELQKRGCQLSPLDLANRDCPELVRQVHRAYVKAGADLITTNTFRAVTLENFRSVVEQGIELAKSAEPSFIALGLGPTGVSQGATSMSYLDRYFEMGKIAEKQQLDLILLETFYNLDELKAVVERISSVALPLFISLSLKSDGSSFAGDSFERVSKVLGELPVAGIGLNCLTVNAELVELVAKIRATSDLPLIIQGSAGIPEQNETGWCYPISNQDYLERVSPLFHVNHLILGGCCGTTPTTIKLLKERGDEVWN